MYIYIYYFISYKFSFSIIFFYMNVEISYVAIAYKINFILFFCLFFYKIICLLKILIILLIYMIYVKFKSNIFRIYLFIYNNIYYIIINYVLGFSQTTWTLSQHEYFFCLFYILCWFFMGYNTLLIIIICKFYIYNIYIIELQIFDLKLYLLYFCKLCFVHNIDQYYTYV